MIPLILSSVAVVFAGLVPLQLHLDTRRTWVAEMETWHGADVHELPAPRVDLAFPQPLTAMELPARDATFTYHGTSRLRAAEAPLVAELRVLGGRHRLGEAPGTETQRVSWNSPTGQFWAIVEFNAALDEPCSHCATPEDGERRHVGCPGCACPCGDVPALPAGVEGHALAGGTR